MKNTKNSEMIWLAILSAIMTLCFALDGDASGQTSLTNAETASTSPPTWEQVPVQLAEWVGEVNTNDEYANVLLWDAPVYQDQVNFANEVGGSYDLYRHTVESFQSIFLAAEARARQAGVAGAFLSDGIGPEEGYMYGSLRVGLFENYVYNENEAALDIKFRNNFEFGFFADQMINSSSALGVFVSRQVHGPAVPIVGLNYNVTFGALAGLLQQFFPSVQ